MFKRGMKGVYQHCGHNHLGVDESGQAFDKAMRSLLKPKGKPRGNK